MFIYLWYSCFKLIKVDLCCSCYLSYLYYAVQENNNFLLVVRKVFFLCFFFSYETQITIGIGSFLVVRGELWVFKYLALVADRLGR